MLHIKFHEVPSGGRRIVSYGQMDKHEKANIRSYRILRTRQKKYWYWRIWPTGWRIMHVKMNWWILYQ